LSAGRANDELTEYESARRESDIERDLFKVRNVKPLWSRFGLLPGVTLGGLDMWMNEIARRIDLPHVEARKGRQRYAKADICHSA
jgi:flavin-dependent dehydrogenase